MFALFKSAESDTPQSAFTIIFHRGIINHIRFANTSVTVTSLGWDCSSDSYRMVSSTIVNRFENLTFYTSVPSELPRVCVVSKELVNCSSSYLPPCTHEVYAPLRLEGTVYYSTLISGFTLAFCILTLLLLAIMGRIRGRSAAWISTITTMICCYAADVSMLQGVPADICYRTTDAIVLYALPLFAWGVWLSYGRLFIIARVLVLEWDLEKQATHNDNALVWVAMYRVVQALVTSPTCWAGSYVVSVYFAALLNTQYVHPKLVVCVCAGVVLALASIVYSLEIWLAPAAQNRYGNPLLLVVAAILVSLMGFSVDGGLPIYSTLSTAVLPLYCSYLALTTGAYVENQLVFRKYLLDYEWFEQLAKHRYQSILIHTRDMIQSALHPENDVQQRTLAFRIHRYVYGMFGWSRTQHERTLGLSFFTMERHIVVSFLRDVEHLLICEAKNLTESLPLHIYEQAVLVQRGEQHQ